MPDQKRKFKAADFVSKIVKDPNAPPNTLLLQGYLGDSSDEGHVRLYLDPQLSDYVEIPESAILHTQEIPNATLGETYVWIDATAEVTHGKAGPQRLKARFLEGRLQQEHLAGAGGAAGGVPGGVAGGVGPVGPIPFTLFGPVCQSRLVQQCHTHAPFLCPISVPVYQCHPSIATPCVSQSLTCQSQLTPCISHNVICPTQSPATCPVASGGFGCGPVGPGPERFAAAQVAPPSNQLQQCQSSVALCVTQNSDCTVFSAFECQSQPFLQCGSALLQCPSQILTQCHSVIDNCQSRLCRSVALPCPTENIHQCPSFVDACPSRLCQSAGHPFCFTAGLAVCPSINTICQNRGF